jgi:NADH-quinone oxidoreductase subunit M
VSPLEILIFIPLAAAIAVGFGAPARLTSLIASVIGLAITVFLLAQYRGMSGSGRMAFAAAHTVLSVPHVQFAVGADGISLTLALLTALVTVAAVWSTVDKDRIYYIATLLIAAGALGAFLTTDIFFIYAFHELALIPTFLMIALYGHGERKSAAWRITIYLGFASLVLLAGLLGVVWYCSPVIDGARQLTFDLQELLKHPLAASGAYAKFAPANFFTLLVGFGALVSLFPFHSWAAPAYSAAPTPIAMMHAGVLKKFGLYGLIRIALPLLPTGAQAPWVQNALLWMLLGNILVIGFVTIHQRRLDDMLANSSVMHMGYIFLGVASGNALGQNGAVLLMFAHGVSIALLFMLCGRLRAHLGTLEFEKLGGIARNAPFLTLMFGIAAFASIGLPGLANFAGEVLVFLGSFQNFEPDHGLGFLQITTILSLWGVVISAVYMLRAYRRIFFGGATSGLFLSDPSLAQRVPMALLAGVLLVVGIYPATLLNVVEASFAALGVK